MSKELTEKWKNETLEEGDYYIRRTDDVIIDFYYNKHWDWMEYEQGIKEVLEPVPTYEEYQDILQQNINQESAIETYIEQIKELEERLADADKTIKMCDELWGQHYTIADGTTLGNSPAWKYMLKWGVK